MSIQTYLDYSGVIFLLVYVSVLLKWRTFRKPLSLVVSLITFPDSPKTSLCKWSYETFLRYDGVIYHTVYGDDAS